MPTTPTLTRDPTLDAHVFWYKFRTEIIAAIFISLLLIIGFATYWFYSERQESAASDLLANAKSAQAYEQVIARFPNTAASASACLLLAEAQRSDQKFVESNATLQTFLNKQPKHELASAAEMAIATNLESLGKNDEALATYRQIAAKYPTSFTAPLALISAVRLLKEKKQTNEARLVCETIINQYSTSFWSSEAMRELSSLKPAEAPSPTPPTAQAGPATPPQPVRPPMALPSAPPAAPAPTEKPTAKPKP
jgi:predicted negative regulator of RcsB-dependent stress response